MRCSNCDEELLPGSSFCGNCGAVTPDESTSEDSNTPPSDMPATQDSAVTSPDNAISQRRNNIHAAETIIGLPQSFYLLFISGPEKDRRFPLEKEETRLGRETDNTLILIDPQVSRHHAMLTRKGDHYEIEDFGSANGVYVNDIRISTPQILKEGDKLKVGNTEILFSQISAAGAIEASEPTISMRDETPPRSRPAPQAAKPDYSPPPPPPVISRPARTDSIDSSTSPRPQPAPATFQRKKGGTTNWLLLSCALIIVLLLILVCLLFFFVPQFSQQFR